MHGITSGVAREEQGGFLQTAGERVRYRVRGDGPPLLMLHGIGAPLGMWRPLEDKLADFQTITVEPPGSGHSSTPRRPFGMREFAGVMDDLLTHLELHAAHLLGLSFGGMIALELARRSPARVERLVLASTPVSGSVNPIELMANMTRVRDPARRPFESAARRFERVGQRFAQGGQARYEQQGGPESSLLQLLWELQGQHSPSVRGFLVQLLAASTWSSRPWLSTLDMPLLAISGSDDRIVPPANSRTIASTVANGRLEIIPGGGHLVVLKQSTRAAELIRNFLRHG